MWYAWRESRAEEIKPRAMQGPFTVLYEENEAQMTMSGVTVLMTRRLSGRSEG